MPVYKKRFNEAEITAPGKNISVLLFCKIARGLIQPGEDCKMNYP